MNPDFEIEYSEELDEELKLLLQEYRDGNLGMIELAKLVDAACRDHFDFKMMGTINGRARQNNNEDNEKPESGD